MQQMHKEMKVIHATKDPEKRRELMREHMKGMQGMMGMMQGMRPKQPAAKMMDMPQMANRMQMMEMRMDAMQGLMDQALKHQQEAAQSAEIFDRLRED